MVDQQQKLIASPYMEIYELVIPIANRHNFKKRSISKKRQKSVIRIEAKNSELKHRHGYDVASSSGLIGMEMQGAMAIFAVNLKRIIKMMGEK